MHYQNGRLLRGRVISVTPVWQTAHLRKQANGMSPVTYQPGQSERPSPFTVIDAHDVSDTLRSTSTKQATPDATNQAAPDSTKQPDMRGPLTSTQYQNGANGHNSTSAKRQASGSTDQPATYVPVTSTHDHSSTNGHSPNSTKQRASDSTRQPTIHGPFTLAHFTLAHTQNNTNGDGSAPRKLDASSPIDKQEMRARLDLGQDQNNVNSHGSTSRKQDAPNSIGQLAIRVQNSTNGYPSASTKQDASGSIDQPTIYAPATPSHDQNSNNGDNSGSRTQDASDTTNQSETDSRKEEEDRFLLAVTNDKDDSDAYSSTSRSQAAPDTIILTQGQTSIVPTDARNDSDTHSSISTHAPASEKTNGIAPDPTDPITPGSAELHLASEAYTKLLSLMAEPENMFAEVVPAQSFDINHQAFTEEPNPVEELSMLTPRTPLRQVIRPRKDREDLNSSSGQSLPPRLDRKAANERDRKDFASLRPRPKR